MKTFRWNIHKFQSFPTDLDFIFNRHNTYLRAKREVQLLISQGILRVFYLVINLNFFHNVKLKMFSVDQTPVLLLYLFYSSDICTIKYRAMVDTFLPGSNNSGEWVLSKVGLHGGDFHFENLCIAFPCTIRTNLLYWCHLVSIGKNVVFYVLLVVRIY